MNKILIIAGFQSLEGHKLRPERGVHEHFCALLAGPLDGTPDQTYGGKKTFPVGVSTNWFRRGFGVGEVANVCEARYDENRGSLEFTLDSGSGREKVGYRLTRGAGNEWTGVFEYASGTHTGLVSCFVSEVDDDLFWPGGSVSASSWAAVGETLTFRSLRPRRGLFFSPRQTSIFW